jgi:hypothetical protein
MELGKKTKALFGTDPSPNPNEGVFIHSDWKIRKSHSQCIYGKTPMLI